MSVTVHLRIPTKNMFYNSTGVGCWLGDPSTHAAEDKKVWVAGGDVERVQAAELTSPSPEKLAINLMAVFFREEQLAQGCCTPAPGRVLLSPRIIHITLTSCQMFEKFSLINCNNISVMCARWNRS